MDRQTLEFHITAVLAGLNDNTIRKHKAQGFTFPPDKWHSHFQGKKYTTIDCGTSGAFLVDGEGELYNIKGYGRPDMNKKKKANLGNIATVDPTWLFERRYNYLK